MQPRKQSTGAEEGQALDRDEVVDALLTASRALVGVAVRSIEKAEPAVTTPQHRMMVLLAARGPQIVGYLAAELAVNSSSATRQCDRLERKGLVTRTRSETDGRAVVVSLTPAGRSVLRTVTDARRAEITAIVEQMPPHSARGVLSALQQFSTAAGEVGDADWSGKTAER